MFYCLAFDRGSFRSDDRYVKIENAKIHRDLDSNNNLKALCTFTSRFENEQELKEALIKLDPKLAIYKHFNLTIIWNRKYKGRNYLRSNAVPYISDIKYFNFESLVKLIASKAYEPFFNKFLNSYSNCSYLNSEIDELYGAVMEYKPMYIIEDTIRIFLNKELYAHGTLSFNKLYKMAMLISKLLGYERKCENIKNNSEQKEHSLGVGLTEAEMFELEWLEARARLREKNGGYY